MNVTDRMCVFERVDVCVFACVSVWEFTSIRRSSKTRLFKLVLLSFWAFPWTEQHSVTVRFGATGSIGIMGIRPRLCLGG